MIRSGPIVFLLFVFVPALGRAEDEPEKLLPRGTQIYMRWDGTEAHRASYHQTALGKMMQGDTGKFISSAFATVQESISALMSVQGVLGNVPPEKLKQMQTD